MHSRVRKTAGVIAIGVEAIDWQRLRYFLDLDSSDLCVVFYYVERLFGLFRVVLVIEYGYVHDS